MTRVEYICDNGSFILKAVGHSDYKSKNGDIVCAAVSALICTLANAVSSLHCQRQISLESGNALISCKGEDNAASEQIGKMFGYTLLGLKLISQRYPNNCKVIIN